MRDYRTRLLGMRTRLAGTATRHGRGEGDPSSASRSSLPMTAPRSVTPFPPLGPRRFEFPSFIGTTEISDFLPLVPHRFVFLRSAVPRCAPWFAPLNTGAAPKGLELVSRYPTGVVRGSDKTSQVPGGPPCTHAPFSDPGGTFTPSHQRRVGAAFRQWDDVGSRELSNFGAQ